MGEQGYSVRMIGVSIKWKIDEYIISIMRAITMKTRCRQKRFQFRRYLPKNFCTACYEQKTWKKTFQPLNSPKNSSWAYVRQTWTWEKHSKMLFRSGLISSAAQISINQNNDFAMKSERVRLLGAPTHPLVRLFYQTTGDTWRALARDLRKKRLGAAVLKKGDEISIPFQW